MNIRRILKHLFTTKAQVGRAFPRSTLTAIETAIKAGETAHVGEIRFVVEGGLDGAPLYAGQSPRERAIEVFSQQRVWDTEHNNGLLIYLLLADRAVEIVADRAIAARVDFREWESVCCEMETAFTAAKFQDGVIHGIQAVTLHLVKHFPAAGVALNELSDEPIVI